MRILPVVLSISALVMGCSTPKYTYYFDRYSSVSSPSFGKDQMVTKDFFFDYRPIALARQIVVDSLTKIEKAEVIATSSEKIFNQPPKEVLIASNFVVGQKKMIGAERLFESKKKSSDSKLVGDNRKNKSAVAGFILALASLFIVPIMYSIGGFFLIIIYCAAGIFLSVKGLKSERRALAIVGLIVPIAILLLLLFDHDS